jgi:hypothetical protein
MEKAIEILNKRKDDLVEEYYAITYKVHTALELAKENEIPPLKHQQAEVWVRLETLMELIQDLKMAEERVGA